MSQAEAALHFLAPGYLDYTVNGELRVAVGNEDLALSPHGFYPDADRPPVRICLPQGHAHAASDAAVGALIAHFERKKSGLGQQVDVSIQQSATLATMFRSLDVPLDQAPAERLSGGVQIKGQFVPTRFALRDGYVVLGPAFLPSTGHFMNRLLAYAEEEGFVDPALMNQEWGSFALRVIMGELSPDAFEPLETLLTAFFATRTKSELMSYFNIDM